MSDFKGRIRFYREGLVIAVQQIPGDVRSVREVAEAAGAEYCIIEIPGLVGGEPVRVDLARPGEDGEYRIRLATPADMPEA